jgi:hypothetical protein
MPASLALPQLLTLSVVAPHRLLPQFLSLVGIYLTLAGATLYHGVELPLALGYVHAYP